MKTLRHAFLINSVERYTTLGVNFVLVAVVSRILTPHDIGVSVIGATTLTLVEGFREQTNFLIQKAQIDIDDCRTAFSIMAASTLIAIALMLISAPIVSDAYGDPGVTRYFVVLGAALLPGPFERPLTAILRRELRFSSLAVVNISSVIVNATVTISLAFLGFSYMSFAWGLLGANVTAAIAAFVIAFNPTVYRITFSRWRPALSIGAYSTLSDLSHRIVEMVTYLIISRGAQLSNVGFFSRALNLNMLPDKLFVAGISHVAFPAIAEYARQGRNLQHAVLRGLRLTTALQLPAYAMLGILAYPVSVLILGPQWAEVSPLLRIVACAGLFGLLSPLGQPALMAIGAFRELFVLNLALFPVRLLIVVAASYGSLHLLAWSVVARCIVSELGLFVVLRSRLRKLQLADIAKTIAPSAVLLAATVLPSLLIIAFNSFEFDLTMHQSVSAAMSAAICWTSAAILLKHPIKDELESIAKAAIRRAKKPPPAAAR